MLYPYSSVSPAPARLSSLIDQRKLKESPLLKSALPPLDAAAAADGDDDPYFSSDCLQLYTLTRL